MSRKRRLKVVQKSIDPYNYTRDGKRIHVKRHKRHYAKSKKLRGILPAGRSGHGKLTGTAKRYRRSSGKWASHSQSSDRKRTAMHRAEAGKPYTGD